jgi:hypothetical protein
MANNANYAEPEGFDVYLEIPQWRKVIRVLNNRVRAIDNAGLNGTITEEMETERRILVDSLVEINVAANETGVYRINRRSNIGNNNWTNYGNNNGSTNNGSNRGNINSRNNRNNNQRNEASRAAAGPGPSSTNTRRRKGRKNRKTRRA